MGKRRKVRKRQIQSRRHRTTPKPPARKPGKWVLVFIAIACSGVAAFWGILHFRDSDETAHTKELGRPPAERTEYLTAFSELPIEQQVAALKKEETELMQAVMRDFPDNIMALEQMGNFLSRHGQSIEAVAFWQKCLDINPKYFNVHRKLGMIALEKGEYEQALEHYRTAARIRPEAEGIHAKIGEALVGLGRYDEAIREVQEEIRISPQTATAHFLLGQAYLKQKAYEKAQSHYEKALELSPKYANACYGLSRVFVGLKQPDKAGEYQAKFRRFRVEDDRREYDDRKMGTADYLASARASVARALLDAEGLYRGRKDFSRSEALLKRAVTIDPNNSKCFERLGLLYSMTKRYPEALRQFERIREIEPSNPRSYLNVGTILLVLNRYDEAEIAYRKVIAIAPEQSQGYLELARLYLNTYKRLGEARKLAHKAISLEASPRGYFILSWACDVTGDRNGALKAIERAISLEPKNEKYRQAYERIKGGY